MPLKPKYSVGKRIGNVEIIQVGPWQTHAPGGTFNHTRSLWWYRLKCICGTSGYWVNQNQLRTHRECSGCQAKHAGRPAEYEQKEPPPVDFLRIPLRSGQGRTSEQ